MKKTRNEEDAEKRSGVFVCGWNGLGDGGGWEYDGGDEGLADGVRVVFRGVGGGDGCGPGRAADVPGRDAGRVEGDAEVLRDRPDPGRTGRDREADRRAAGPAADAARHGGAIPHHLHLRTPGRLTPRRPIHRPTPRHHPHPRPHHHSLVQTRKTPHLQKRRH